MTTKVAILHLELDHLSLPLLVTTDFKVFASLDGQLLASLALGAFHTQHNLLGGLSLFTQDGLRLATESLLFSVVTTTSLGGGRFLSLLVLGHLVEGVLLALALAEGPSGLGNVDHGDAGCKGYNLGKTKTEPQRKWKRLAKRKT